MRTVGGRRSYDGVNGRIVRVARDAAAATLVVLLASLGADAGESAATSRSSASEGRAPHAAAADARRGSARGTDASSTAANWADERDTIALRARPPEQKKPGPPAARPSEPKPGPSNATESKSAAAPESPKAALGCLSQALYWEAGIEGREGMIAVGWVVLNRTRSEEFPGTVCGVVKQGSDKPGCQFSYWCDGKSDAPKQDANWALAEQVAREMLTNPPPDPTGGAIFYHAVDIRAPWSKERTRTAQIGRHLYYR